MEHQISSTLRQEGEELTLQLPAELAVELSRKVAEAWKLVMDSGKDKVVLLCDSRLRYPLAAMLSRTVPVLSVIAYDEIVLGTEIEPLELISIQQSGATQPQELVGVSTG